MNRLHISQPFSKKEADPNLYPSGAASFFVEIIVYWLPRVNVSKRYIGLARDRREKTSAGAM